MTSRQRRIAGGIIVTGLVAAAGTAWYVRGPGRWTSARDRRSRSPTTRRLIRPVFPR